MDALLKYFFTLFIIVFFLPQAFSQKENSKNNGITNTISPNDSVKFEKIFAHLSASFKKKDFHLTDSLFNEAVVLIERTNFFNGVEKLHDFISNDFLLAGNYQKALDYSFILKATAEKIKYTEYAAVADNQLGTLYWYMNDNKNALMYYKKVLDFDQKFKKKRGIAASLNNLGMVYRRMNLYKEAGESYYQALLIVLQTDDKVSLGNCYNNIGVLHQQQKEYPAALDFFFKSLEVRLEIKDSLGIAISYGNIGGTYAEINKLDSAEKYSLLAFEFSEKLKDVEGIYEACDNLTTVYERSNRFKEALHYYRIYIENKNTLSYEDAKRDALKKEMEIKFEQELRNKSILAEAEKRKQTIFISSSLFVLFIVCVFSFLLYRRFRFAKKQNAIIESQKHLVENKNKEIVDSINYAKRLQDAILPPDSLIKTHFPNSFVLYKPKDIVAGDFYWMEVSPFDYAQGDSLDLTKRSVTSSAVEMPNTELILIAAADCTGHGVPGAIVSVVCSNALNRTVKEFGITDPGSILNKVRELVIETFEKSESEVKDGMDISLAAIHSTPNSELRTVKWAGANNPLWIIKNGKLEEIKADKQPIGKTYHPTPFTTQTVQLNKGDSFYLFTDGYADQFGGPRGKKFMHKQLQDLLLENSTKPMTELKEILNAAIESWKGKLEQIDDILLIGITA